METITDLQRKYHNMAIFQSKDIQCHHLLLLLKQLLLLWRREYVPPMPTAPLKAQSARNSDSANVLPTGPEERAAGTWKLPLLQHLLRHQ